MLLERPNPSHFPFYESLLEIESKNFPNYEQVGKLAGGGRMLVSAVVPFFTMRTVSIPQLACLSK